jgi:hypothetical protein
MSENESNGNNGSNDSGKLELMTAWINPENVKPFTPSPRQVAYQELAIQSCEEGKFFKKDWMARSREHPQFQKIPMRQSEWAKWSRDYEFVSWFYDAIPQAQDRDEFERRMMDNQFWTGLSDGLQAKKEWAYSVYAKVAYGNNAKQNQSQQREQIRDWLGSPDEAKKWKGRPAEA